MHKLREENSKLKDKYKQLKARYKKLEREVDEEISNKWSMLSIKAGAFLVVAFTLGRITK